MVLTRMTQFWPGAAMTSYVDDAAILYRGKLRYHLTADSIPELHAFCERVGIKRCWWHSGSRYPHYDINEVQRAEAIKAGAVPFTQKEVMLKAKSLYKPR